MEKIFVYGILAREGLEPAVLPNHQIKEKAVYGNYRVVEPAEGQVAHGFIRVVSPEGLEHLDRVETEAYSRVRVTLADGQEVWTYTWGEACRTCGMTPRSGGCRGH